MQVNDELIDKLSSLSMLQFSEEERERMKTELEKMIGFVNKLEELDTSGVEPLLHMSSNRNVLRDDLPGTMLSREEALKNAPKQNGVFIQVPKVIKKDA